MEIFDTTMLRKYRFLHHHLYHQRMILQDFPTHDKQNGCRVFFYSMWLNVLQTKSVTLTGIPLSPGGPLKP